VAWFAKTSAAVTVVLFLSGCGAGGTSSGGLASLGDGCTIGTAVGAAAGGITAAALNGGRRQSSLRRYGVPALGAAGGGFLGNRVGCMLSQGARDRAKQAVRVTASSGQPQSWASGESGTSGRTRVVGNTDGCRTIEQVITLADGTRHTEQVRACKGQNGWEAET